VNLIKAIGQADAPASHHMELTHSQLDQSSLSFAEFDLSNSPLVGLIGSIELVSWSLVQRP